MRSTSQLSSLSANCRFVWAAVIGFFAVSDLEAGNTSLLPTKDAHVRNGSHNNSNFGSGTALEIKDGGTDYTRRAFVAFDLPANIPANVEATLTLNFFQGSSSSSNTNLGHCDSSWTESGITWNNQPEIVSSLASVASPAGTVDFDVSSYLQSLSPGTTSVSFVIWNSPQNTENYKGISSRESASPPVLKLCEPELRISHPEANFSTTTDDSVLLKANKSEGTAPLDEVRFFVDGVQVALDTTSPYEWVIPSGSLSAGLHNIKFQAVRGGTVVEEKTRSISVGASQELWSDFKNSDQPRVADWSRAGYRAGLAAIPKGPVAVLVTDHGAIPDDGLDDGSAVQAAITAAETAGGGVVFFPPGQFDFHVSSAPDHALTVSSSGVILRGSGNGPGGTVLKQHTSFPGTGFIRKYLVHFDPGQPFDGPYHQITADAARHSRTLQVADNSSFSAGDILYIRLVSPDNLDGSRSDVLNLVEVGPLAEKDSMGNFLYIQPEWIYFNAYTAFSLYAKVESIGADRKSLVLQQPLPRSLETAYTASVRRVQHRMIGEVGIEDLRIVGNFTDNYVHHKNYENDYGWNGVGV